LNEVIRQSQVPEQITVGVDVGGTKTHLALSSGEQRIVSSAGWHRGGLERVAEGIAELLRATTSATPAALAVGSHGCNDRMLCARLERNLRSQLGDLPILAVNDAELLLPSVGAPAGVGLIAGTGSIAVGYREDDEMVIAGGWGGYIGDEGSSTGMFRDAARAVAQAYDRGDPEDPLVAILCGALGIDHLRELPRALDTFESPPAWAHLTPSLFTQALEQGSALIHEVIEQQALGLANLIGCLRGRGAAVETVVAGGGVVVNAGWFEEALRRALEVVNPESTLIVLADPPVVGALNLAADLAILSAGGEPDDAIGPVLRHLYPVAGASADERGSSTALAGPVHSSSTQEGDGHP
jgi:N-acetylglucosamine kinase-like BadF-type ATPase